MAEIDPNMMEIRGPHKGHNGHKWFELRDRSSNSLIGTFASQDKAEEELDRLKMRRNAKTAVRPKTGNEDLLGGDGADAFLREHHSGRL